MPKLHSKTKVLGGRAQVISYERDPSVYYYRELITGTTSYRSKRLEATTEESAVLEAVDAYAALRGIEEAQGGGREQATKAVRGTGAKSIRKVIKDYLSELTDKVTAGIAKQATYDVAEAVIYKLVLKYCDEHNIKTVNDIKVDTWKKYLVWRQQTCTGRHGQISSITKLTMHKEICQIKKWTTHYLLPHKLLKPELAMDKEFIPYPKINHEDLLANPAINPDDWLTILNYMQKEWLGKNGNKRGLWSRHMMWNWVIIAKNTGARPEELLKLKWKDVEFEDVGMTTPQGEEKSKEIAHVVLKSSKTGQLRVSSCNCVYVFERWLKYQKGYCKVHNHDWQIGPNDYVWAPPYNRSRPLTYSYYKMQWQEIREKVQTKLKGHIFSDEPYTIYSLRSTFVEDALIQGKDIFLVAKAAGHDVKTLMKHYERIDPRKRGRELTEGQYGHMPKTSTRSAL